MGLLNSIRYASFFDELEKIASSSARRDNEAIARKNQVAGYEEFKSRLRPGDIIFSDGRDQYEPGWSRHFFKPLSVYYQRSRFGHSAIYVGGDHIIDARIERPTLKSSLKELVEQNHVIAVSPHATDAERAEAVRYAHDQIGRPYSFVGLLRSGLGLKGKRNKVADHADAMICSALVANAYANKKFSEGSRLFVQPAEILRSKIVTPVAMLVHPDAPASGDHR